MKETTPLDSAHAAMEAAPGDSAARLRFYERLADGELFLMLRSEAAGGTADPEVYDLEEGRFVLAFDREERLASFAGAAAPYAALSGRSLAAMLAPQGLGLGLNLGVAPSAILLPPDALGWLAETVAQRPERLEARIAEIGAPSGLPESLVAALDTKLASAAGLAEMAYLAGVAYESGGRGHLLAFIGARPGAEEALAGAAGEALAFSGLEAAALDVAFFAASDAMAARLARNGLRFDLPQAATGEARRTAPGRDPSRPPILR